MFSLSHTTTALAVDASADAAGRAALTKALGRKTVFGSRDCAKAIADRRDFKAGNMHGERAVGPYPPSAAWSQMDRATSDLYAADNPGYVVFSYNTPIGWISRDGRAVVPAVGYSISTTRHQGEAREGLMLAVIPGAVTVTAWGAVGLSTRTGWEWIDGELVSPETLVNVTARRYRSRVTSERVVIGTVPASQAYDARAVASRGQDWSGIELHRA